MLKKRIILACIAFLLIAIFVIPGTVTRIQFENSSKVYVTAIDLTRVSKFFKIEELPEILNKYIEAGATTAIIHEAHGSYPRVLLEIAKNSGIDIAITPDATVTTDADIEKVIERYKVKYIVLQTSTLVPKANVAHKYGPVTDVIEKYGLTVVINEHILQLGNDEPSGFDKYLEAADGRLIRAYRSYVATNVDVMDYPAVYYQMYISVCDRNTRFVNIKQLEDVGFTPYENAERTMKNLTLLCDKLEAQGFEPSGEIDYKTYSNYANRLPLMSAATAAASVLMLVLAIDLLFKKCFMGIGLSVAAVAFAATLFLPESLISMYPSLFATFAPCFSVVISALFIHKMKDRMKMAPLIISTIAVMIVLLALCGAVIAALLGGTDYFLNLNYFRGVKLSLIAPMVVAGILLLASVYKTLASVFKKRTLAEYKQLARDLIKKIHWYHIALIVIFGIAAAIYVIRSGNVSKISFLETNIRNGLTEIFTARPRTKEIIASWPCLILYIYFAKKNRAPLIQFVTAIGASTLFASIINTFCHVFTMVETMYMRVAVGMLFGIPVALLALGVCALALRVYDKKIAKVK